MRAILSLLILIYLESVASKSENSNECTDVEIVTRDEWRARPWWRYRSMKMPINNVIIQHTVSSHCKTKPQCIRVVQAIQDYAVDKLAVSDIPYNFLVGGDGRVYEGRGWTMFGAHTYNFNTVSLGIAFIGNFMEVVPNEAMINATLKLIDCGVEKGFLTPTRVIHGHRDVICTLSPGDKLYAIIRTWKNFKGGRVPGFNC